VGLKPILELDYSSFRWYKLSDVDFTSLSVGEVPFTSVADAGTVSVMDFRFDPLVSGEPAVPAGLRATSASPGFYMIQFVGPTKDSWWAQLEAAGISVLQYYPQNTYLTWTTGETAKVAEGLRFVRWQGSFQPAYKISPFLRALNGRITNVAITFYNDGNIQDTLTRITDFGGGYILHSPAQPDGRFYTAIFTLDASRLVDVARINTV